MLRRVDVLGRPALDGLPTPIPALPAAHRGGVFADLTASQALLVALEPSTIQIAELRLYAECLDYFRDALVGDLLDAGLRLAIFRIGKQVTVADAAVVSAVIEVPAPAEKQGCQDEARKGAQGNDSSCLVVHYKILSTIQSKYSDTLVYPGSPSPHVLVVPKVAMPTCKGP